MIMALVNLACRMCLSLPECINANVWILNHLPESFFLQWCKFIRLSFFSVAEVTDIGVIVKDLQDPYFSPSIFNLSWTLVTVAHLPGLQELQVWQGPGVPPLWWGPNRRKGTLGTKSPSPPSSSTAREDAVAMTYSPSPTLCHSQWHFLPRSVI